MNKLRVWHVPQMPMETFRVPVDSPEEAIKILKVLWDYDSFQYENDIKPDYSSASGLEEFVDNEIGWYEWYHPELDADIIDYVEMLEDENDTL